MAKGQTYAHASEASLYYYNLTPEYFTPEQSMFQSVCM